MKQKIVIRVSMNGDKSRSKALKTVVAVSGVESAALTGDDKNQVEVVGDGVDAVVLTRALRKHVSHAVLVSVGEAKKEEMKPETPASLVWPYYPPNAYQYPIYEVRHPSDPCTIM